MSRPRRSLLQPRRPTRLSESSLGDTPAPAERAERAVPGAGAGGEDTVPLARASSPSASEPTVSLDDTQPRAARPASLEPTVELPPPPEAGAAEAAQPAPGPEPAAAEPAAAEPAPGPKAPRPAAVFTPFRRMFTRGDSPPAAGPDRDGQLPADLVMAGGLVLLGLGAVAAGAAAGTFGWLVTMGR